LPRSHTITGTKSIQIKYRGADKSLAQRTYRFILFDGEIFRLMLILLHIYSTNISPIMTINRIYETQNLLSL